MPSLGILRDKVFNTDSRVRKLASDVRAISNQIDSLLDAYESSVRMHQSVDKRWSFKVRDRLSTFRLYSLIGTAKYNGLNVNEN